MKRKITQYLRRAEEIFTCHLQRAAGCGISTATVRGWRGAHGWDGSGSVTLGNGRGGVDTQIKQPRLSSLSALPDATLRWCRGNGRCIKLPSVLACQWLQGSWQLFTLPGSRSRGGPRLPRVLPGPHPPKCACLACCHHSGYRHFCGDGSYCREPPCQMLKMSSSHCHRFHLYGNQTQRLLFALWEGGG